MRVNVSNKIYDAIIVRIIFCEQQMWSYMVKTKYTTKNIVNFQLIAVPIIAGFIDYIKRPHFVWITIFCGYSSCGAAAASHP